MKESSRGIKEFVDDVTGEMTYHINYCHRGKVLAQGGPFFSFKEAVKFRDSELDKKNIKKVKTKDGKIRFIAEIYVQGKKLKKSFNTFAKAYNWRREKRIAKNVGKGHLGDKMTFGEFSTYWLENEVKVCRAESTQELYERLLKMHVLPFLEDMRLDKIKIHHINELIGHAKNQKQLAVATLNLIISTVQRCFEFAVENDCLNRNILKFVKKIKGQVNEAPYWEIEDLKKFFDHLKGKPAFLLFYTAAKTGMRKGEIAGLRWDSVDLRKGMIKCRDSRSNNKSKGETKSKKERFIPLTDELHQLFREEMELRKPERRDFVFLAHGKRPISYHSIGPMFHQYQNAAKVSRKISFHDLRHTFSSHFSMEGGKLEMLQLILGHSNYKMTQRYAHFSQEYLKSAKDIIDKTEV